MNDMTKLEQLLSQYAAYHLDHKNVVTHFIGIPMIVFSIICLIITYYFNLFISQSVYTRSELSNILPQLGNMIKIIYNKYYT